MEDRRFIGYFMVAIALIFLIFFTSYAFSSSDKINKSPTTLGPFMRSFVVSIWLIAALIFNRKKWHRYSVVNILIGIFAPLFLLLVFGYPFDYGFSMFSYCFISAISTAAASNPLKGVGIWIGVFVFQFIVDLCLAISGLYGPFRMS